MVVRVELGSVTFGVETEGQGLQEDLALSLVLFKLRVLISKCISLLLVFYHLRCTALIEFYSPFNYLS